MSSPVRKEVLAAALLGLVLAPACGPIVYEPRLHDPDHTPLPAKGSPPLKVHLRDGELVVLDVWRATPDGASLVGQGTRYDLRRQALGTGPQSVSREHIILLETNDRRAVSTLATVGLGSLTVFFGAVSAICAADPKSCFGSCPTFYVSGDDRRPVAEGFSASIARVLEAVDVDALPRLRPRAGQVALTMRNEALETHAVRRVRLLAVEQGPTEHVVMTPAGAFHALQGLRPPDGCRAPEGDCRDALARGDGRERKSFSDPHDLATREELHLDFARAPARAGLVIQARQSLLTTFLFYQTLAYMGGSAGEHLAALERGGREQAPQVMALARRLGGIDVAVRDADGRWRDVGLFDEAGPISGDTQLVALPPRAVDGPLRIRLRMARGLWRLDHIALGELGDRREPRSLPLVAVERGRAAAPEARRALERGESHLVTLPGDEYRLVFAEAGDGSNAAFFLESEGYYYEWIRADWLPEEDPARLLVVLARPEEALRLLAGAWKAREAGAERTFWSSRFARPRS